MREVKQRLLAKLLVHAHPQLSTEYLSENTKLVVDGIDTDDDQIFGLCARMLGTDVITVAAGTSEAVIQVNVIVDPIHKKSTTAPHGTTAAW